MDKIHSALMVAVVAAVTIMLRFLPFMIFGKSKKTPDFLAWLSNILPYTIMAILVVYCLRNISFVTSPYGIPEIISCLLVAGLHIWKRNTLISIIGGTVCYMILIQVLF